MHVTKAVLTAAGRNQRSLPLQMLIDRDGAEKAVLEILLEEALDAGVDEFCVVVCPGDEARYAERAGDHAGRLHFVAQKEPRGYGHAVLCAREFVGEDPFLLLVGDHLYVSRDRQRCAEQLVRVAESRQCAVSGVQATRETLLPYFGVVGGTAAADGGGLYRVNTVIEKPTPTEAEQKLIVPALRAGHYLCFFGMHVLTPGALAALQAQADSVGPEGNVGLSEALNELAEREEYLALEIKGRRYDVGVRYGLLTAQLALALSGQDRDEVLSLLLQLLAQREQDGEAAEQ